MWSVQCAGRTSNSWSFSCKRKQNRWFRCGDTLSVYLPSTKIPMHAELFVSFAHFAFTSTDGCCWCWFFFCYFIFLKNLKTAFRTLCSLAIRSFANIQPKVLSVGLRFFRSCGPFTTVSHFLYLRNNFERVSFRFEGLLQLGISWRSRHHFEFSADVIFDQKPFRAKHRSTRHLVSQCNKFWYGLPLFSHFYRVRAHDHTEKCDVDALIRVTRSNFNRKCSIEKCK